MNNYLVIITTVLVITQVIRVTQNAISLHRQNTLYDRQLKELKDLELKKDDFEMQKRAYRLIVERLSEQNDQ